jgi:hypothetical protein
LSTERARAAAVTLALAMALAAAPAAAQPSMVAVEEPPTAAPRPARLEMTLALALRVTALDRDGGHFVDDALAYGWRGAARRPPVGARFAAHYLATPRLEATAGAAWQSADVARGFDEDDRLNVELWEASVGGRLRWAEGRPMVPEPKVELGLALVRTTVHGTADRDVVPFVRVGADWRLGTRRAGAMIAIGYTMMATPSSDGPAPPVGGLDLAIGPYVRF